MGFSAGNIVSFVDDPRSGGGGGGGMMAAMLGYRANMADIASRKQIAGMQIAAQKDLAAMDFQNRKTLQDDMLNSEKYKFDKDFGLKEKIANDSLNEKNYSRFGEAIKQYLQTEDGKERLDAVWGDLTEEEKQDPIIVIKKLNSNFGVNSEELLPWQRVNLYTTLINGLDHADASYNLLKDSVYDDAISELADADKAHADMYASLAAKNGAQTAWGQASTLYAKTLANMMNQKMYEIDNHESLSPAVKSRLKSDVAKMFDYVNKTQLQGVEDSGMEELKKIFAPAQQAKFRNIFYK